MHAEVAAICERVYGLIRVRDITISHTLQQICHLRLHAKRAAWKRDDGFDRREVIAERQRRTLGHGCLVDDPKRREIEVYLNPRLPPTHQFTESMWAEVNWLRLELMFVYCF